MNLEFAAQVLRRTSRWTGQSEEEYRKEMEQAERAICRAAAEISGLTAQWAESASGAIEDEFSMETGKPIMAALRRFAELAKEE